jgi:predicted dehydrogenase
MRRTVMADKGPAPAGPYSHAVVANGFVFVSGQGPVNPETGNMPDAFADQVRQTLEIVRTMNVAGVDRSGWRFPETRHWPVVNGRVGGAARLQMEHFLECVTTGTRPLCDGQAGRGALAVCLAAEASLAGDGAEVSLSAIERTKDYEHTEGRQDL